MAERIVDDLEVVEVYIRERKWPFVPTGPLDLGSKNFLKRAGIGSSCEMVNPGKGLLPLH